MNQTIKGERNLCAESVAFSQHRNSILCLIRKNRLWIYMYICVATTKVKNLKIELDIFILFVNCWILQPMCKKFLKNQSKDVLTHVIISVHVHLNQWSPSGSMS